jgi:hypothetical protein
MQARVMRAPVLDAGTHMVIIAIIRKVLLRFYVDRL